MIDNPIVPWRHTAANTYKIQANPAPIAFLHAAAGFPAKETWLHVVEANFYSSLSGISPPRVRRHLTELNILHPSRINPKISVYTQIHGAFDFNKTVYAKINRAWYELIQSGHIAHDDLAEHLVKHDYVKTEHTEGLFHHKT